MHTKIYSAAGRRTCQVSERLIMIKLSWVFDCLMTLFLLLNYFFYFISPNPLYAQLRLIPVGGCALIGSYDFIKKVRNKYIFCFALFFITNWICVSILKSGEWIYGSSYFKYTICYLGAALGLASCRHSVLPYKICFYFSHLFLLYQILFLGRDIRTLLVAEASYNYISVLSLFYFSIYSIVLLQNGEKIKWHEIGIYFILCILGYGRGGIVTACLGVLVFLAVENRMNHKVKKKVLAVVSVSGILLIVHDRLIDFIQNNDLFLKFQLYKFSANGRSEIWAGYLELCMDSLSGFFLGADPVPIDSTGNMHNEYLQAWACFGLVFMLFFAASSAVILGFLWYRKYYYHLIIFVMLLSRGFTDKIFFYGNCEICLFYFVFFYMIDKSGKRSWIQNGKERIR